jgi:4-hydroxy-2-oxoheptanedioate aldolase
MSPPVAFKEQLKNARPQLGVVVCTGSAICAEICASSGLDWLMIDCEHSPNDVHSIVAQLQAVQGYPIYPVVRPASGDPILIKQLLDVGAQNFMIPMVESREQAEALVQAVRYPPRGIRGVGSSVARASRWNRDRDYLKHADDGITLVVLVETAVGLKAVEDIASVDGVDGVSFGPADLSASLGHLGEREHPEVLDAIDDAIRRVTRVGKPAGAAVGVGAAGEVPKRRYRAAGATFFIVGTDVGLLAHGTDQLVNSFSAVA